MHHMLSMQILWVTFGEFANDRSGPNGVLQTMTTQFEAVKQAVHETLVEEGLF